MCCIRPKQTGALGNSGHVEGAKMQKGDGGNLTREAVCCWWEGVRCGEEGCSFPPQFKRTSHVFGCASLYGVSYIERYIHAYLCCILIGVSIDENSSAMMFHLHLLGVRPGPSRNIHSLRTVQRVFHILFRRQCHCQIGLLSSHPFPYT